MASKGMTLGQKLQQTAATDKEVTPGALLDEATAITNMNDYLEANKNARGAITVDTFHLWKSGTTKISKGYRIVRDKVFYKPYKKTSDEDGEAKTEEPIRPVPLVGKETRDLVAQTLEEEFNGHATPRRIHQYLSETLKYYITLQMVVLCFHHSRPIVQNELQQQRQQQANQPPAQPQLTDGRSEHFSGAESATGGGAARAGSQPHSSPTPIFHDSRTDHLLLLLGQQTTEQERQKTEQAREKREQSQHEMFRQMWEQNAATQAENKAKTEAENAKLASEKAKAEAKAEELTKKLKEKQDAEAQAKKQKESDDMNNINAALNTLKDGQGKLAQGQGKLAQGQGELKERIVEEVQKTAKKAAPPSARRYQGSSTTDTTPPFQYGDDVHMPGDRDTAAPTNLFGTPAPERPARPNDMERLQNYTETVIEDWMQRPNDIAFIPRDGMVQLLRDHKYTVEDFNVKTGKLLKDHLAALAENATDVDFANKHADLCREWDQYGYLQHRVYDKTGNLVRPGDRIQLNFCDYITAQANGGSEPNQLVLPSVRILDEAELSTCDLNGYFVFDDKDTTLNYTAIFLTKNRKVVALLYGDEDNLLDHEAYDDDGWEAVSGLGQLSQALGLLVEHTIACDVKNGDTETPVNFRFLSLTKSQAEPLLTRIIETMTPRIDLAKVYFESSARHPTKTAYMPLEDDPLRRLLQNTSLDEVAFQKLDLDAKQQQVCRTSRVPVKLTETKLPGGGKSLFFETLEHRLNGARLSITLDKTEGVNFDDVSNAIMAKQLKSLTICEWSVEDEDKVKSEDKWKSLVRMAIAAGVSTGGKVTLRLEEVQCDYAHNNSVCAMVETFGALQGYVEYVVAKAEAAQGSRKGDPSKLDSKPFQVLVDLYSGFYQDAIGRYEARSSAFKESEKEEILTHLREIKGIHGLVEAMSSDGSKMLPTLFFDKFPEMQTDAEDPSAGKKATDTVDDRTTAVPKPTHKLEASSKETDEKKSKDKENSPPNAAEKTAEDPIKQASAPPSTGAEKSNATEQMDEVEMEDAEKLPTKHVATKAATKPPEATTKAASMAAKPATGHDEIVSGNYKRGDVRYAILDDSYAVFSDEHASKGWPHVAWEEDGVLKWRRVPSLKGEKKKHCGQCLKDLKSKNCLCQRFGKKQHPTERHEDGQHLNPTTYYKFVRWADSKN